ncbi:hypothetical protein SDC9_159678 [bioreactor metagenome]|uniref:Uncharacterized protein n=1 Tax=bioreactor metagenome TaxID=1076179 RepID=A0A645FEG2_9ZZZZ
MLGQPGIPECDVSCLSKYVVTEVARLRLKSRVPPVPAYEVSCTPVSPLTSRAGLCTEVVVRGSPVFVLHPEVNSSKVAWGDTELPRHGFTEIATLHVAANESDKEH